MSNRARKKAPQNRERPLREKGPRAAAAHTRLRAPAPVEPDGATGRRPAPVFVLLTGFALLLGVLVPEQIAALLAGQQAPIVSRVLWLVTTIVVGNAVLSLMTLSIRDAYLKTSGGAPQTVMSRSFFEQILVFTATGSLWCLLVAIFGLSGSSEPPSQMADLLGRAVTMGIIVGLLAMTPKFVIRTVRAFIEAWRVGDRRTLLFMAAADVVVLAALPISLSWLT